MLARSVTRLLTIAALRGSVLPESNLFDSQFIPADRPFRGEQKEPFAIIYTEKSVRPLSRKMELDLVIDIAAGIKSVSAVRETEDGPIIAYDIEAPPSDGAAELACDMVEDDIAAALTNIENSMSDAWREFCELRGPIQTLCGSDGRGVPRATRRLLFPLKVPVGPQRGTKLTGSWDAAVGALEAFDMPWMRTVGELIRTRFEYGEAKPWVHPVELAGLSQPEVRLLHMPHSDGFVRTNEPPESD
ncbi:MULTISPECIES: hypothetical protein [unclassified Pseudovibrio]|uniref:hypothetical protein n=1 Tax=unclassified Pseudovibrio TaxID=2627060 RepID=UPI0007AE5089|nr:MULTISPECIES: hypothetical protein [unclassified Pseudovibrio]KZL02269.1 hypothetical protein PsW74_01367 [Pseudovibrio sp. W74]KZL08187.1 hypothetical protein PsAD14_03334 [Pseudovibrio sp. Ad14]